MIEGRRSTGPKWSETAQLGTQLGSRQWTGVDDWLCGVLAELQQRSATSDMHAV